MASAIGSDSASVHPASRVSGQTGSRPLSRLHTGRVNGASPSEQTTGKSAIDEFQDSIARAQPSASTGDSIDSLVEDMLGDARDSKRPKATTLSARKERSPYASEAPRVLQIDILA